MATLFRMQYKDRIKYYFGQRMLFWLINNYYPQGKKQYRG